MSTVRIAAIQLNVTDDRSRNLAQATKLVERAVAERAQFITLPENSDMIAPREVRSLASEAVDGPFISTFRSLARDRGVWILVGSFAERSTSEGKVHNTSVLVDDQGAIRTKYRKIHLFDANPADGVSYRESDAVVCGTEVVTADTPWGRLGMSVCYDVRFPEQYREMSRRGVDFITVPAAFTVPTGAAHWDVLLRARAIENLSYVIAPAQVGDHGHGRRSYGHAMIVSPWGEVLGDAGGSEPGLVIADCSIEALVKARAMIPALSHRRL